MPLLMRCGLLRVSSRLLTMCVWLGMAVVLGLTMMITAMIFVHAFMEDLCFLPGMLAAGGGSEDQRSGGEGSKGGLFHDQVVEGWGM